MIANMKHFKKNGNIQGKGNIYNRAIKGNVN